MNVYHCASDCGNEIKLPGGYDAPIFCSKCGGAMKDVTPPPYVGKPGDTGIYRVTFAPVEAEFYGKDGAEDAAYHSAWGEDREFGDFSVEEVLSTVPVSEYPYVCANPECEGYVSKTDQGRCSCCSSTDWKLRKEAPQKKPT